MTTVDINTGALSRRN
ncbi:hypothetical protein OH492_22510 [Vibrio chagasii]|nr:hypothetical protein [Vibrio chagasii]